MTEAINPPQQFAWEHSLTWVLSRLTLEPICGVLVKNPHFRYVNSKLEEIAIEKERVDSELRVLLS